MKESNFNMNTFKKVGYGTEEIKVDKKANMAYWDNIDWLAEGYLRELLTYSMPNVVLKDEESDILEIGKEITELAIKMLESRGANFPYVDENY